MGLRIFVRDAKPLESIARRLDGAASAAAGPRSVRDAPAAPARGSGDVTLVLMLDLDTEVDVKLPGRFRVSPQIAGAIKAVPGVIDVQTV